MAEDLEYGRLTYSARPGVFRSAVSPVLVDGDLPESLNMVNILVRLTRGREMLPSSTASYSALAWFDVADAIRRIEAKEPFQFPGRECGATYLCGGLCICTSHVLLNALAGGDHCRNNFS